MCGSTQICKKIKHCVRVDMNQGGTWATLKSLQVYLERHDAEQQRNHNRSHTAVDSGW